MIENAHVYVMVKNGKLKVGCSKRPYARAKELRAEILHLSPQHGAAERVEKTAHRLLRLAGKHHHGEWFTAELGDALAAIERAVAIIEGRELQIDAIPRQKRSSVLTVRVESWMVDRIDALIEHERHGQGDRATIIREAIAAYLER